jgi:hypothetical protein
MPRHCATSAGAVPASKCIAAQVLRSVCGDARSLRLASTPASSSRISTRR